MEATDKPGITKVVETLNGKIADLEKQVSDMQSILQLLARTNQSGAVIGPEIPDDYVAESNLAKDVRDKLSASIGNSRILDSAITSAKIADGTIQTIDLADGIVKTAKIADGQVTSAKIADGTIQATDIAKGAVGVDRMSTAAQYLLNGGGDPVERRPLHAVGAVGNAIQEGQRAKKRARLRVVRI